MDHSQLIVLLARQRSGTNALGAVAGAHPDITAIPEVLNQPAEAPRPWAEANYWTYLRQRGRSPVAASNEAQAELFRDYLFHLRTFSPKRYLLIDVKYNVTHVADGPYRAINAQPALFDYIEANGMRVLNLTRRNHLRTYLSFAKATRTSRWIVTHGDAPAEDPSIRLDPDELLFHMRLWADEDALVARRFAGNPRALTLEYDDLFPVLGGAPAAAELSRLAAWLGVPAEFPDTGPKLYKQAVRPLTETIENFGEVAAALAGTEFEHCLRDERAYR
jgi:hypothetical protein